MLPLDNRAGEAILNPAPRPFPARSRVELRPGGGPIPEAVAIEVKRRSHTITAEVDVPEGGADGVLIAMGSTLGGYTLYVQDGRLQYVHNFMARSEDHLAAADVLTPGRHSVAFSYRCDEAWGGGHGSLLVDGTVVAEGAIERFTPMRFSITGAGMSVGYDSASPVTRRYRGPFEYEGTLHRVVIETEPEAAIADYGALADSALRRQ